MAGTDHDVAIVGGGCIGCSIARHLAESTDYDVCVVEKEYHLAAHQSGRNSGVLHPGFNYPPGSLKADFATRGTAATKAYCEDNGVPLDELGVLVVATDGQEERRLHRLKRQADENGVTAELLESRAAIREHEPHAAGRAALYCPEAASVDSRQYVYALARDAENLGVDFYVGYTVTDIEYAEETHAITTDKGTITASYLVNAAGLYADRLAHRLGVGGDYRIVPFRGEYYELVAGRRHLVRSMLYPTPDPDLPFLGVHYTRRTDGKVIVGPNAVLAFGREAYHNTDFDLAELRTMATYGGLWRLLASPGMIGLAVDELNKSYRKGAFVEAARELLPEVAEDDFVESYAGIRAQVVSAGGELVKEPLFEHGPRSTHVLNAVSPGLTCSLPFGEWLAGEVDSRM